MAVRAHGTLTWLAVNAAFDYKQLPFQEWSRPSRRIGKLHSHSCNPTLPLCSLLAYNWREYGLGKANAGASQYREKLSSESGDRHTGPADLKGVTQFVTQGTSAVDPSQPVDLSLHAVVSSCPQAAVSQRQVDVIRLQDIVELVVEHDEDSYSDYDEDAPLDRLEQERYLNVLGPIASDDEPIAIPIIELLGPDCKAGTS